ncbi:MAG: tRNA pseudouridine(55) synthase TruB [Ruminococcaceae bacterium]|nr:tRNA pseudouridine(55) synthase TruB [Oscillospiraceae bacterium]
MASGIIIIDKSPGWTSQDVAAKLRGIFSERRVGHGGTLDPMATGVLPIFLGRATRAVEFFESADKEYVAGLRLGMETDTEDITGEVLREAPVQVTRSQVEVALSSLNGEQMQVPPMYSAVKIHGKKLYELARAGKQVERPARKIVIHETELLEGDGELWQFRVHCSKGTYVRTLCAELGKRLGCGGCMHSLRRTRAGRYDLSGAHTIEELLSLSPEERQALLLPVDSMFLQYPALHLSENQTRCIRNGGRFTAHNSEGTYRFYGADGSFLALGQIKEGMAQGIKSFFEVN